VEDREKKRLRQKRWYEAHKEEQCEKCRLWKANHPGYNAQRLKAWREDNPDYGRSYRDEHRENVREQDRARYSKDPALFRNRKRQYNQNNKDKIRAHNALSKAVSKGLVKRSPCEVCGDENAEGHHDDYDKPLSATWLCGRHHQRLHADRRKEGTSENDSD
jgi:hypothetical protein